MGLIHFQRHTSISLAGLTEPGGQGDVIKKNNLLSGKKCKQREVGGTKKPKTCQCSLWTAPKPAIYFITFQNYVIKIKRSIANLANERFLGSIGYKGSRTRTNLYCSKSARFFCRLQWLVIQGISYWSVTNKSALRGRRIHNFIELWCLVGSGGLEIWVSSTSFQESNRGWPQKPLTEYSTWGFMILSKNIFFQNTKLKLTNPTNPTLTKTKLR